MVLLAIVGVAALGLGPMGASTARADASAATSVSLQVQQSPLAAGSEAAVTVTVAALSGTGAPTGTVQVSVDGAAAGSPLALVAGSAVWYDSALKAGTHTVTASYGGDASFAVSAAAAQTVVVLPKAASAFTALTPARILDTRADGPRVGYTGAKPKAGATVALQVLGKGGVPATGVSAVVLNVTATGTAKGGYVTVWPAGTTRPVVSTLNATGAKQTVANLAVVPVGANGKVDLFVQSGADLIADVQGYFTAASSAAGGRLVSVTPSRILDTRADGPKVGYTGGKPKAGATVPVHVLGRGGVPATGVTAVAVNVTAAAATKAGYVTVWPAGKTRPLASSLNLYTVGQTRPNAVWVPVGANGTVDVYVSAGAQVIVDVDGYFTDATAPDSSAGLFVPTAPTRLLDTRAKGPQTGYTGGKPKAGQTVALQVSGRGPVPATGAAAVVGNTTSTDASAAGYVTVWPAGKTRPLASNVNLAGPGDTAATLTSSPLGTAGGLDLYTRSSTDLIFDAAGYFTADPTPAKPVTESLSDTPAPGTDVVDPAQVTAVTPGDAGPTVVLGAGVPVPATGTDVVVTADANHPDGATGSVVSATPGAGGTTALVLSPQPLDTLFSSMSLDYNGPADLEAAPVPDTAHAIRPDTAQPAATMATGSGGGGGFDFSKAFQCTSSGLAVAVASLTFENTSIEYSLHIGPGLTPDASFVLSTEPVVRLSASVKGTVSCTLTSAFRNANTLSWRILVEGIPVTVTLQPTLSFKATADGDVSLTEHFYRSVGFATNPDGSIGLVNSGAQHTDQVKADATLKAGLSLGADISAKVLDIVGVTVSVAPEFDANADGKGCVALTAKVNASLTAQLNLWVKKWKKTVASGQLGPWTLYSSCPVDITTTSLSPAGLNQPYDEKLEATGGAGPLTWTLDSGSLPAGLTLSADGEITGTPTSPQASDFTVRATDPVAVSDTAELSLPVLATAPCNWDGTPNSGANGYTCTSTVPTIKVDMTSTGDSSACEFSVTFDWGDGSPQQTVTAFGGVNSNVFLAQHTYGKPGKYTVPINGHAVIGSCPFTGATLTFTLQAADGSASSASGHGARSAGSAPPAGGSGPRTTIGSAS